MKFQIQLEPGSANGWWYTGGVIRGTLIASAAKAEKYHAIRIKFGGEAYCRWTESNGSFWFVFILKQTTNQ